MQIHALTLASSHPGSFVHPTCPEEEQRRQHRHERDRHRHPQLPFGDALNDDADDEGTAERDGEREQNEAGRARSLPSRPEQRTEDGGGGQVLNAGDVASRRLAHLRSR